MITPEVWWDKLPEDKVKYYNRTRMSLKLFSRKLDYTAPQVIIKDLEQHGYRYNAAKRAFE